MLPLPILGILIFVNFVIYVKDLQSCYCQDGDNKPHKNWLLLLVSLRILLLSWNRPFGLHVLT